MGRKLVRQTSSIIWQDTQHQVLFVVLDRIKDGCVGMGEIEKLQIYAENHFAIEEEYMEQLQYPHREQHIMAHNKFREELQALVEQQQDMDSDFQYYVGTFLTEWLTRHVFGIDKQLEDFIQLSSSK